jgi:hypothetical protein
LGRIPRGSEPGGGNSISWFEIGSVWAIGASAAFDPIILFDDSVRLDDDTGAPKEVLEVEWTGCDLMAFIEVVVEGGFLSLTVLEDIPAVVLEIS